MVRLITTLGGAWLLLGALGCREPQEQRPHESTTAAPAGSTAPGTAAADPQGSGAKVLPLIRGLHEHQDVTIRITTGTEHFAKGLVILSGCAHAGIVNTARYARQITGVGPILAIMGGFHLGGPDNEALVRKTVEGLAELDPDFIVPTHCTGRKAVMAIEAAMPEKFILNMAGTRLTFAA